VTVPKNEDDTDYGWRATPTLRWKVKGSMRELEQLWRNAAGESEWREVPWVGQKEDAA